MPIYYLNNKRYNIPDDVVKDFEKAHPDATIPYSAEGNVYDIPVYKRDKFLKKYPEASPYSDNQLKKSQPYTHQYDEDMNLVGGTAYDEMKKNGELGDITQGSYQYKPEVQNHILENKPDMFKPKTWDMYGAHDKDKSEFDLMNEGKLYQMKAMRAASTIGEQLNERIKANEEALNEARKKQAEGNLQPSSNNRGRYSSVGLGGTIKERQEAYEKNFGKSPSRAEQTNMDDDVANLLAEQEYLKESKKVFDAAKNDSGFFQGMKDAVDASYLSFGLTDKLSAERIDAVQNKLASGEPLSDSEQSLLTSLGLQQMVNEQYNDLLGRWYKAGMVTAEMAPFMAEMAVNPLSGLGKSAMKFTVKKFGEKGAKAIAAKVLSRTIGDVAGAAGMSATTSMAGVTADALERQRGYVKTDLDTKRGAIKGVGFEGGEDASDAWRKAFTSRTIENWSEMVGEYFSPIGKAVGKGFTKAFDKMGLSKVNDFIDNINSSEWVKLLDDFSERTQWNGPLGEFAEEQVGMIANAALVGDTKWSYITDLDKQLDVALGVGVFGTAMSLLRIGGYRTPKYRARKALERADKEGSKLYGEELWETVKFGIDNSSDEELGNVLATMIAATGANQEQAKAAFKYANALKAQQAVNTVKEKAKIDMPGDMGVEAEAAYDEGSDLQTPADKHQAKLAVDRAEAALGDDAAFVQTVMNGAATPVATINAMAEQGYSEEQIQKAKGYYSAMNRMNGMTDALLDEVDSQIESANVEVDMNTNKELNQVIKVVLRDGRQGYVVNGTVTANEEGVVDVNHSDSEIMVRFENGDTKMMNPNKDLQSVAWIDSPAKLKENNNTVLRQSLIDKGIQEIDWNPATPNPKVGDSFEMDGIAVTIVGHDGHGGMFVLPSEEWQAAQGSEQKQQAAIAKAQQMGVVQAGMFKQWASDQLDAQEEAQAMAEAEAVAEEVVAETQPTEEVAAQTEAEPVEAENEAAPVEEAKLEKPVIPTKEDGSVDFVAYGKEGSFKILGEKYGEKMPKKVEVTAKALANDLKKAENAISKAQNDLDNAPIGRDDKQQAKLDKAKQDYEAVKREADFWAEMDADIKAAQAQREAILNPVEEVDSSAEPQSVDEFVAQQLASGNIVLNKEDFKRETGFGTEEVTALNGGTQKLLTDKGMTIQEAGERLMEMDRENGTNFFDQSDSNAGRDALIDLLGSVKTRKELNQYVAENRKMQAKKDAEGYRDEMEKAIWDSYHISLEEFVAQIEYDELNNPYEGVDLKAIDAIFAEAELEREQSLNEQENESGRNVEGNQGQSELLSEAQSDNEGGSGASEGERTADEAGVESQNDGETAQGGTSGIEVGTPQIVDVFAAAEKIDAEEKRRRPLRARANEWAKALGVRVHFIERVEDVKSANVREALKNGNKVAGWYSQVTGEVFFLMPNLDNVDEIDNTYVHEVVAHKGMFDMLGKERYDELCDKVWEMMPKSEQKRFINYPGVKGNTRIAADEYIAHLSESLNLSPEQQGIWDKIVQFFRELFDQKLNGILSKSNITKEDISNLIKASYANLKSGSNENVVGEGERFMVKKRKDQLKKAERFIEESLKGKRRNKMFTIELPQRVINRIKSVVGDVFDSHNLSANSFVHAKNNHGVNGADIDEKSIPLRDEDFKLAPYIMIAPDKVERGSNSSDIRQSIRFTKFLSNGEAVVVEKEQKNSPDDMETITMWADLSSNVVDARFKRPRGTTSETVIISMDDAAKIRKDAEKAIEDDENRKEKSRFRVVYHGSGAEFDKFDHSFMGTGEGNQSFGWGTYVTDVKGIGENYGTIALRGKDMFEYIGDQSVNRWVLADAKQMMDRAGGYDEMIKLYGNATLAPGTAAEQAVNFLKSTKKEDWEGQRHLYEVEIPDDNGSNYIAWDKMLPKEQAERIKEAIRNSSFFKDYEKEYKRLAEERLDAWTKTNGGRAYKLLGNIVWNEKDLSQILSEAGFVGFKYPTNYMSGGNKEGTNNYVIFDENDLKIVEHTRFRVAKDKNELVAVHNISEDNLRKVLNVGGLIMPSIAITKADMGHEGYGEISLLFDKETINPSDRRNKVYGGDAWTPRFPHLEIKLNGKVVSALTKKMWGLFDDRKVRELYSLSSEIYPDNIERKIANDGVEGYYGKEWMKLAYLLDSGKKVKIPMKMKDYGEMSEMILEMAKKKGLSIIDIQYEGYDFYQNNPEFVSAIHNAETETFLESLPEEKREKAKKAIKDEMSFMHFDTLLSQSAKMEHDLNHGGLQKIIDKRALTETINKKVKTNNQDYNKWVDSLFDGIIEKYGIRNNKDMSTPSGNARPWEQLHDAATPANILKYMLAENEQGGSGGFFDSNIMGASAESYESIEQIREKGKKRLRKLEEGEYDEWSDSVSERMSDICNDFLSAKQRNEFGASIDAKIDITNAVAKDKTASGIYKTMKRDYPGFTMEHAKKVEEIVKEIQDFAIGYFEAKPRRIVPLSEVRKAIVPKKTSEDILEGLRNNGIEVAMYKNGDEAARARLIKKESNGIRFRISNQNQEIFVSNAQKAVEGIKQEKATPQQWLAMIEKNGGLKAGEYKWLGLSDWLKGLDKKSVTKAEILDFIGENKIQIEEVHYAAGGGIETLRDKYPTFDDAFDVYESPFGVSIDIKDNKKAAEIVFDIQSKENPYAAKYEVDEYEDFVDNDAEFEIRERIENAIKYEGATPINSTRLEYTTEGLDNKQEIALTVPTIESWNEDDEIHFGDAGEGRAVAWIRFGETTAPQADFEKAAREADEALTAYQNELADKYMEDGGSGDPTEYLDMMSEEEIKKMRELSGKMIEMRDEANANQVRVLVIDEIQSKRHQEGREKGYRNIDAEKELEVFKGKLKEKYPEGYSAPSMTLEQHQQIQRIYPNTAWLTDEERGEYEELQKKAGVKEGIPEAPFEKNWSELAFKRMLRYAAENGYDKVAWTTGAQQAERYNIGTSVDAIISQDENYIEFADGTPVAKTIILATNSVHPIKIQTDREGNIHGGQFGGNNISSVLGKELATKVMEPGTVVLSDLELYVGGEGMKAFYDKMLPSFVNKYVKKWGTKVQDIELPNVEEAGRIMHSVDVTDAMKESVMEGQTMFRIVDNEKQKQIDKEYVDAVHEGDFGKAVGLFREYVLSKAEEYGVVPIDYAVGYRGHSHSSIAKKVKEENPDAISEAAYQMSKRVPKGSILVPMPSRSGKATYTIKLAEAIAKATDSEVKDVLKGEERMSVYEAKKKGLKIDSRDLGLYVTEKLPKDKNVIIVDNVIDRGITALAAVEAVDGGSVLAYAFTKGSKDRVVPLKLSDPITYDENLRIIPLSERFNANTDDLRFRVVKDPAVDYISQAEDIVEVPRDMEFFTMNNVANKLYQNSGRFMRDLYKYGTLGRVLKGEYAEIDQIKAKKEYDHAKPILDEYLNQLVWMKHHATEAAQDVINDVISDVEYAMQYYKDLALGKDVWRTNVSPRFRISEYGKQVKAEVDRVTSKYKGKEVMFFDAEMTDEEVEAVAPGYTAADLKPYFDKGALGGYSSRLDKISIFADNNPVYDVEDTIFHENLHVFFADNKDIVEAFAGNALSRFPKNVKSLQEKGYSDKEIPEELLVRLTAKAMSYGIFDDVRYNLPESEFEKLKEFLKHFGYDYREEVKSRSLEEGRRGTPTLLGGEEVFEARRVRQDSGRQEEERRARKEELGKLFDQVADMGLDGVLENRYYGKLLMDIYQEMPLDVRRYVSTSAVNKYGGDFVPAMSDYLNVKATAEIWGKVVGFVRDVLRKVGFDLELNQADVKYMLWRSQKPMKKYSALDVAEDIDARRKFGVDEGERFRTVSAAPFDPSDKRNEIVKKYDAFLKKGKFNFIEAFQDRMYSVKVFMDMIVDATGKKVRDFEDAYEAENQLGSINKPAEEKYLKNFYKPIVETLNTLSSKYGRDAMERYVYCKSGLERNEVLRQRDADEAFNAAKEELDDKLSKGQLTQPQYDALLQQAEDQRQQALSEDVDYSGIRGMLFNLKAQSINKEYEEGRIDKSTRDTRLANLEANRKSVVQNWKQFAENEVAAIESRASSAELKDLWKKINAATNETLRMDYESGMIDKATYDAEKNMMKYYVPLRNWADTTAEEMYEYRSELVRPVSSNQKRAKGRESQADNPIATIALMAQNAIVRGNRNKVKQKFYAFVANRETGLASVRDVWYVKDPTTDTWEAKYADTTSASDAAEFAQILDDFETDMQVLESQGLAYKGKLPLGMKFRASRKQKQAHVVPVMINGKEYAVYVNGNPRPAQAMNGETNSEAANASAWYDKIKRIYGAGLTSWNPDFIIPNMIRDGIHASTMTFLDAGPWAAIKFAANGPRAFGQVFAMVSGVKKHWINPKYQAYFEEFVANGGETGYTAIHTLEDYKKEYDKLMNEVKGLKGNFLKKGFQGIAKFLEATNRIFEDVNRFNAYVSARESGESIMRSISAAKNITVNFNRKGALSANNTAFGTIANAMSKWILFFNPAVQGIAQLVTKTKVNPKRAAAIASSILASGFFMPMLNEMLVAANGGDDEDDYWNQSDFKRRNNWLFFIGDGYASVPLPPVLRELYGIGDIIYGSITGHITPQRAVMDMARQVQSAVGFVNLIPEVSQEPDMVTWAKGFAPDIAAPVLDVISNTNFMGRPIAKWTDFNEYEPEYERVYKGVSPQWVELSKLLNKVGGDEGRRSDVWGNFINPAMMEHLFTNYGGGIGKTINNLAGMALEEDTENLDPYRKSPIVPRFYTPNDEKTVEPAINRKYYDYDYMYNVAKKALKNYQDGVRSKEHPEWKKYIDEMQKNGELEFIRFFEHESKRLTKMQNLIKGNPTNKKELEEKMIDLKADIATKCYEMLK